MTLTNYFELNNSSILYMPAATRIEDLMCRGRCIMLSTWSTL